jgi:hypothetical protein
MFQKKRKKKLKSDSEFGFDSDSDSGSDFDSIIPKKTKKIAKKSNVKQDIKQEKEELCKNFNDEFDELFDSKKHKVLIDKITTDSIKVSKKNIIDAIIKTQDDYKELSSLCILINTLLLKYNIPDDVYIELFGKKFTCTKYSYPDLFIPLTTDFKDSLYDLLNSKKTHKIKFSYHKTDKLTNGEYKNLFHIYLMLDVDLYDIIKLMPNDKKYLIDNECLKYLNLSKHKEVKNFVRLNMLKIKIEADKIIPCDLDNELFKNKTVDKINDFITQNNYKVTQNTVIIACQKNIDFNIIKNLINYKVNFTENGINEIIKNYLGQSQNYVII